MSEWFRSKPQKHGLHRWGGRLADPVHIQWMEVTNCDPVHWEEGWWAWECEVPAMPKMPEPKYRYPTMDDVGEFVEVRDVDAGVWKRRILCSVLPGDMVSRFVCRDIDHKESPVIWRQARIVDDGKVKQQPREWVIDPEHQASLIFQSQEEARRSFPGEMARLVHVREVIGGDHA